MTLDMTQTDDIPALMADIGARAKAAAATLGFASADQKQTALEKAADALIASSADILAFRRNDGSAAAGRRTDQRDCRQPAQYRSPG